MTHPPVASTISLALLAAVLLFLSACTPSLSPLYRDYEMEGKMEKDIQDRIQTAVEAAGWKPVATEAPNAIATESRTIARWGLYKVTIALEVVPVSGEYVRVFFHPYRKYITGGRSKIPYLASNLRRSILPDLNRALADQGFRMMGIPFEKDEVASEN